MSYLGNRNFNRGGCCGQRNSWCNGAFDFSCCCESPFVNKRDNCFDHCDFNRNEHFDHNCHNQFEHNRHCCCRCSFCCRF